MSQAPILSRLRFGAATNLDLQIYANAPSHYIARDCARLMKANKIKRLDDSRGRGSCAKYALVTR